MPNWCEGALRVRGKTKDIQRWIKEGLNKYSEYGDKPDKKETWLKKLYENDWHIGQDVYVEGTTRGFLGGYNFNYGEDQVIVFDEDPEYVGVVALVYRQAWGTNPDEFVPISKKYHIDFRFWGSELGMGFWETWEVCDGEVNMNPDMEAKITLSPKPKDEYNEFLWNCPFPFLGG